MKNTKYFDSVQDVNNYYPDGVPSNVIAIVGDGSNVFISSDNAGSGNQQYYSADMTNDEIVAEQVQAAEQQGYDTGYTAGETAGYTAGEAAGYDTGYAAGQAAGGTNWLDVLYLDEKAKAESFLNETLDFYKYNFAKYATSEPFIEQQSALAFIYGLQSDSTMFKLIKITKDADDNAIITYNPCSINFDGQNVGAIALDGVTYYNKICVWGTLTLAAGDEVIMDCATVVTDPETGDMYALGLFGGFDNETNDPATYKCETAGTYTFGIWVDVPQVQDGQAACFVSTMFNYEGSATVPAIGVPSGLNNVGYFTDEQLENVSKLMFGSYEWFTNYIGVFSSGAAQKSITISDMASGDGIVDNFNMAIEYTMDWEGNRTANPLCIYIDKYSNGVLEVVKLNEADATVERPETKRGITYSLDLNAGDKVGLCWACLMTDPETQNKTVIYPLSEINYAYRMIHDTGEVNEYDEPIITHFYTADTTGRYRFSLANNWVNDSWVPSMSFEKVVQP